MSDVKKSVWDIAGVTRNSMGFAVESMCSMNAVKRAVCAKAVDTVCAMALAECEAQAGSKGSASLSERALSLSTALDQVFTHFNRSDSDTSPSDLGKAE